MFFTNASVSAANVSWSMAVRGNSAVLIAANSGGRRVRMANLKLIDRSDAVIVNRPGLFGYAAWKHCNGLDIAGCNESGVARAVQNSGGKRDWSNQCSGCVAGPLRRSSPCRLSSGWVRLRHRPKPVGEPLYLEVFINGQPTGLIANFVQLPAQRLAIAVTELAELRIRYDRLPVDSDGLVDLDQCSGIELPL